jgi:hypothetical protein
MIFICILWNSGYEKLFWFFWECSLLNALNKYVISNIYEWKL